VILLPGAAVCAADPEVPEAALTEAESQALLRIIRNRAEPGAAGDVVEPIPARLDKPLGFQLMVAFFHRQPTRFQHVAEQPTLRACAEEAGDALKRFFTPLSHGERIIHEGRIQVDIIVGRSPLAGPNRALIAQRLVPGLEGLACADERRQAYFAPLTLLRHWRSIDPIEAMYVSQESVNAPIRFTAERLATVSCMEQTARGKVVALYRGNVLHPQPQPWNTLEAMSTAGLRLLAMAQDDGSFSPAYYPGDERFDESDNALTDQIWAALAITELQHLVGDELLLQRRDEALRFVFRRLHEEQGKRFAYLPVKHDSVTPSALLLTTLCRRALTEAKPTVTGRMRYLGEFLCVMTTADGRLHTSVADALAGKPPYIVKGAPYVESLMALTQLQRISDNERVRQTAERLANRVARLPATLPRIRPDVRIWPRTIEALAEYYKITRKPPYGRIALRLAEQLTRYQARPGEEEYADYLGGLAEPDLPPSTRFTAASVSAFAAVYDVGNLMKQPVGAFAASLRQAAGFLVNMQYRPENSFFLYGSGSVLGAFRRSPEDLSVQVGTVAEATRALMLATPVIAETVATEPPEKPAWKAPAAGGKDSENIPNTTK